MLNRSLIFVNAHSIARKTRKAFKNYAQAFKIALKKAYEAAKKALQKNVFKNIVDVAQAVIESQKLNGNVWEKGQKKRLYLNRRKSHTFEQVSYIDLNTFDVKVYTDCPSQPWAWIQSQNRIREKHLAPIARLIKILSLRIV